MTSNIHISEHSDWRPVEYRQGHRETKLQVSQNGRKSALTLAYSFSVIQQYLMAAITVITLVVMKILNVLLNRNGEIHRSIKNKIFIGKNKSVAILVTLAVACLGIRKFLESRHGPNLADMSDNGILKRVEEHERRERERWSTPCQITVDKSEENGERYKTSGRCTDEDFSKFATELQQLREEERIRAGKAPLPCQPLISASKFDFVNIKDCTPDEVRAAGARYLDLKEKADLEEERQAREKAIEDAEEQLRPYREANEEWNAKQDELLRKIYHPTSEEEEERDREACEELRKLYEGTSIWDILKYYCGARTGEVPKSELLGCPENVREIDRSKNMTQLSQDPDVHPECLQHAEFILGVDFLKASSQEIKGQCRKLSLKYHPDKNPNENTQKEFILLQTACETLRAEKEKK